MDLQEANNGTRHNESLSEVASLNFDRFIGSLGSFLPAPGETMEPNGAHDGDLDLDIQTDRSSDEHIARPSSTVCTSVESGLSHHP